MTWHPLVAPLVEALSDDGDAILLDPAALALVIERARPLHPDEQTEVALHLGMFGTRIAGKKGALSVEGVLEQLAAAARRIMAVVARAADAFAASAPAAAARRFMGKANPPPMALGARPPAGAVRANVLMLCGVRRI